MGDLPRYHELGDVIAGLLPFNLDELPINIRARVVLLRCEKYLKTIKEFLRDIFFTHFTIFCPLNTEESHIGVLFKCAIQTVLLFHPQE